MGFVGDFIGDVFGGGDEPSRAARDAAEIQAQAQREALDYLKEREAIPQQFREGALTQLGGLYGLPGGKGSQQQLIEQAIASPLYGALMGGQEAGEEAIMRQAAATGGLRSGNVQAALYDYNTQLQNQALLESYNQQLAGLQGLAQLPSGAQGIAQTMAGIGQTQAQGLTAAAQAQQASTQQGWGNLMGLGSLGIAMFSDRRLKRDIKRVGQVKGWNWYTWKWNSIAEKMGLKGECQGCMADEVFTEQPDAVVLKDMFMMVIYDKLGVFCHG